MLTRRELLNWSPPTAPLERDFVHLSRLAMACRFEVTLPMSDRAGLAIARRALAQVDLHEQQLTIFNETSQLSHINRNAALHPVPAQPSLFALLLKWT